MKIRANPSLPYSTLNPETNSDSPSAKSKGVRFVSAKQEISHTPTIGKNIIILDQTSLAKEQESRLYLPARIKKNIKRIASLTSYDTVWATARSAPTSAYFLLEAQPEIRTG